MALKATNLAKYLARYAEPEAALPAPLGKRYEFAVVVPVCGEHTDFTDGWRLATQHLPATSRVLFVLVVNSDVTTAVRYLQANDALLEHFGRAAQRCDGSPTWIVEYATYDVLLIDRHSPSRQLPPKSGVGLARKIGSDIVCAWFASGVIDRAWWLSTDADVILPSELSAMWRTLPMQPGVVCLPFLHVAGSDPDVDVATWAVEVNLRYHVLGMAYAGSTYAWPALGSCLAVHAHTYAAVRGFPKRLAGEDFYLLEKASKLGGVVSLSPLPNAMAKRDAEKRTVLASVWEPIRIVARRSARTPFGTGHSVNELLCAGDPELVLRLRSPVCYTWLKALLEQVRESVEHGSDAPLQEWLTTTEIQAPDVTRAVTDTGLCQEIRRLATCLEDAQLRYARINEWFDGLRQVQFLKAIERTFESLPYRQALHSAPFVGEAGPITTSLWTALEQLRRASGTQSH